MSQPRVIVYSSSDVGRVAAVDENNTFTGTNTFGGETNYLQIDSDGKMQAFGDATMWDDVSVSVSSVRVPTSSAPTWTAYKGGQVLAFGAGSDEIIYFSCQLPHGYKVGSNIEFHIHTVYPDSNSGNIQWNFTYSWASIGSDFPEPTPVPVNIAASEDADKHSLDEIVDSITGTGKGISSVLLCSLEREGTHDDDTYASDVYLVSLDFHIEKDTFGSDEEASK